MWIEHDFDLDGAGPAGASGSTSPGQAPLVIVQNGEPGLGACLLILAAVITMASSIPSRPLASAGPPGNRPPGPATRSIPVVERTRWARVPTAAPESAASQAWRDIERESQEIRVELASLAAMPQTAARIEDLPPASIRPRKRDANRALGPLVPGRGSPWADPKFLQFLEAQAQGIRPERGQQLDPPR